MNTTRSAALRAKPISWLTTIMVMPLSRRERMTSSTEPTSSGSSALVGSSNSMTARLERDRARDGDPLLLAARELARRVAGAVGEADPLERGPAQRLGLGARLARDLAQRQRHVAERRHVRIEVEGLEHHADALAGMVDVGSRVEHVDAVHHDASRTDGSSSRLRQRSRVDLPEPDGPMTNTSSRSATLRSTPFRT